jgi:tetratricopeptide (TPR) repeat protein
LKELEQSLQRHIVKHGEKSPKVAMDYLQIGNEHFRKGHMMEAEANYMLAVQCDPSEHLSKAYLNLGTVKWRTGDLPSAIHFLQRALGPDELGTELRGISLEESTTAASAYHQLGICYALCGEWQRAISSLEAARMIRVRVLGPADVSVGRTLDMIGKVWSMQGNYEEAMNYYQKALVCLMSTDNVSNVSDANIATVLLNMARVQMTAGHPGAALTALQRAYKLLKTDMVAGRNCGEFQDPMKASLYQQTLQMLDRLRDLDTTCQAMKCLEEEAG